MSPGALLCLLSLSLLTTSLFLFHLKLAQSRVPMFPIAHTSRDRGVSLRVCQTQCYQLSETRRDQMKARLGAGRRGCAGITCVVRTGPPASPLLWKQEDNIPFPTGVGAGTRSSRSTARLCSLNQPQQVTRLPTRHPHRDAGIPTAGSLFGGCNLWPDLDCSFFLK